jgi:hypothetical protein
LIEEDAEESSPSEIKLRNRSISKSPSVAVPVPTVVPTVEVEPQITTKNLVVKIHDIIRTRTTSANNKSVSFDDSLVVDESENKKFSKTPRKTRSQQNTSPSEYKLVENVVTIVSDDEDNGINEILSIEQIKMKTNIKEEDLKVNVETTAVGNGKGTEDKGNDDASSLKSQEDLISSQELLSDEMRSQASDIQSQNLFSDSEIESSQANALNKQPTDLSAVVEKTYLDSGSYSTLSTDEFIEKINQAINEDENKNE